MAIQFVPGQVAIGDPAVGGPNATSNIKDVTVKVVKLSSANFATAAVNTKVAVLPADASILRMELWVKTQLAGGSISAATINVGSTSAGTEFVSAFNAFGTAGAMSLVTPITNIVQNYQAPAGGDINIWVGGTATTGNPTSGEIYLSVYYVR